jgi:hypothetical protein
MTREKSSTAMPAQGWRFWLGLVLFVLGLVCPVLIPLIAATALPAAWKATLSGLLALGIPELCMLAAVAVLGKAGFESLKGWIFAFLKLYAPPERVSRRRYRIGLIMLALPLLFGWLAPYAPLLLHGYQANSWELALAGDVLLIASLFVLGGAFWDKVRALFIYEAQVQLPTGGGVTNAVP